MSASWRRTDQKNLDLSKTTMPNPTDSTAISQATPESQRWTLVIQPHGSLFDLKLRELWHYRDLVALFVRRDFVAQYKQTILGPAWHFISPLMTTVVFTIVFGKIAKIPTDGTPPFLFYMAGNLLWAYFSAILAGNASTFTSNAGLFGKVYFPRLAVPISQLISRLIAFAIQFTFFLCFLAWFAWQDAQISPNAWALATPLLLLMLAALGLGIGVICSALTTKYRDLSILIGYGLQLFMYATPIIYPISVLPEEYRSLAMLNPVAPIIELFRYGFLGAGTLDLPMLGVAAGTISLLLLLGVMIFNTVERTFIDTV
jgi:lipopolysaccharide transport system permease protein